MEQLNIFQSELEHAREHVEDLTANLVSTQAVMSMKEKEMQEKHVLLTEWNRTVAERAVNESPSSPSYHSPSHSLHSSLPANIKEYISDNSNQSSSRKNMEKEPSFNILYQSQEKNKVFIFLFKHIYLC